MPSLGKISKKLIRAANDGKKRTIVAKSTSTGSVGRIGDVEGDTIEYINKKLKSNDNVPDVAKQIKKADDQSKTIQRLLELADEGDQFALNKYAKRHFNTTWTELKKDPQIKDML